MPRDFYQAAGFIAGFWLALYLLLPMVARPASSNTAQTFQHRGEPAVDQRGEPERRERSARFSTNPAE